MSHSEEHDANHIKWCLQQFIGQGKVPVEDVARDTGINARTVQEHISSRPDSTHPKGIHLHAYKRVFGAPLASLLDGNVGIGGHYNIQITPGCAVQATFGILDEMWRSGGIHTKAVEDLRIDHVEKRELPTVAMHLAVKLSTYGYGLRTGVLQ